MPYRFIGTHTVALGTLSRRILAIARKYASDAW